ncbi:MAG TPA: cell division protein ZapA [Bryobacteraceae bacterium]|nr:cell division protein ZapA [Bryobacteraceae bacterium]
MDTPEKLPVRVSIFNQTFTLLVAGDPADIQNAANDVDELMHTIARSGNMDATRVAMLACLHLQDRVRTLESEFKQLQSRVESASREFALLLDDALEG